MATRIKRRVWIGALFAGAGVAGWIFWTRSDLPGPATLPAPAKPFVQYAGSGGDQALQERADLLDPTPLFFPTDRNYGQQPLRESLLKQPGQVFSSFEPKLPLSDRGIVAYGLDPSPVAEKLSDVLTQGNEAPFAGMGQIDLQNSTLPIRSGYLEVHDLNSG